MQRVQTLGFIYFGGECLAAAWLRQRNREIEPGDNNAILWINHRWSELHEVSGEECLCADGTVYLVLQSVLIKHLLSSLV